MEEEALHHDILFLACTRPAMWQGIPLQAAGIIGVGTLLPFIALKNPIVLVMGPVLYLVVRAIVARDYNMFGIIMIYMLTKGSSRNKALWGGCSVMPRRLMPIRRAEDIRSCI